MANPGPSLSADQRRSFGHRLQRLMETFQGSLRLRVVSRTKVVFYPKLSEQMVDDTGCEMSPLIREYDLGETILGEEA